MFAAYLAAVLSHQDKRKGPKWGPVCMATAQKAPFTALRAVLSGEAPPPLHPLPEPPYAFGWPFVGSWGGVSSGGLVGGGFWIGETELAKLGKVGLVGAEGQELGGLVIEALAEL